MGILTKYLFIVFLSAFYQSAKTWEGWVYIALAQAGAEH